MMYNILACAGQTLKVGLGTFIKILKYIINVKYIITNGIKIIFNDIFLIYKVASLKCSLMLSPPPPHQTDKHCGRYPCKVNYKNHQNNVGIKIMLMNYSFIIF